MSTITHIEIRDPYLIDHPAVQELPEGPLDRDSLGRLARELAADPRVWRPYVRHDPSGRWFARLLWRPELEVYVLGWAPGQETTIHDHGETAGVFCVAEGRLHEDHTRRAGRVPTGDRLLARTLGPGDVATFGPEYLHNLGNREQGPATSIHAYSPPLSVMRFYDDVDGTLGPVSEWRIEPPTADPALATATSGQRDTR
ncbi:cysteine dioxygenase [Egibacter rhizosphaerae]|uniref:cysteine dioxygenase n=1 Tax=Egibacter rhizosphaerae TaxID=1670831 RepID=UPI0013F15DC4|nr:cysteine dioxygenase family protein [Egibacter rhizosphaerae]